MASDASPLSKPRAGIILGPDGKPCKACNSLKDFTAAKRKINTAAIPVVAAATSGTVLHNHDERAPSDCPADVERLGRHTWTLLHSMAAYYPDRPTLQHQGAMRTFMASLPLLYPCSHCAGDLADDLKRDPPDVETRERLSRWMCVLHNGVNRKLGKEEFDCSRVDERWRDGWKDGHCD